MPPDIQDRIFAHSDDEIWSVDIHPTKPWLLAGLYQRAPDTRGTVKLYDLESGANIHTYELAKVRFRSTSWRSYIKALSVKFIARKNWFGVTTTQGVLYVFDYNTHETISAFQAHREWVRCLVIHPSSPIVLTACDAGIIKAWDWDKQWHNIQTYKGHSRWVKTITFHPEDSNVFVSGGDDGTVKIWTIASPIATFTTNPFPSSINSVNFFPVAEKLYLMAASNDNTIRILDDISKNCVREVRGHTSSVKFAVFHPNLPIIISGSGDKTVKFWNCEAYTIEHTLRFDLGEARCIAFRKDTNQVAVGFDKGLVILEVGPRVYKHELFSDNLQPSETQPPATQPTETQPTEIQPPGTTTITSTSDGAQTTIEGDCYRQCVTLVMEIVRTKATNKLVFELEGDKAQNMVDFLSQMVDDEANLTQPQRKRTLYLLSRLAKSAQVFPQSLELKGVHCDLTKVVAAGGFGYIYKGEYEGNKVCVKAVHTKSEGVNRKQLRAQASELIIWAHILHMNVLPFFGMYPSDEEDLRICIVSPWMDNGDLSQYLRKVPDTPRMPLTHDIVSGLTYLHEFDIIHADLKAQNVIVSKTGRAMLTDFGISRISVTFAMTSANAPGGTLYWMAPELLVDNNPPSCSSDIWAFACTCYEIITGMVPFGQYRIPSHLIIAYMQGKIVPPKPAQPGVGWDEDVWSVAIRCWKSDPESRPKARELLNMINSFEFLDDRSSEPQPQRRRSHTEVDCGRILKILAEIRQPPAV